MEQILITVPPTVCGRLNAYSVDRNFTKRSKTGLSRSVDVLTVTDSEGEVIRGVTVRSLRTLGVLQDLSGRRAHPGVIPLSCFSEMCRRVGFTCGLGRAGWRGAVRAWLRDERRLCQICQKIVTGLQMVMTHL